MAKRKTNMSETLELLRQHVDLRTSWGKEAWSTIEDYVENKNTSKISLLRGLAVEFPDKPLIDILNIDPVDYQRNVKAKCVCGQGLSREAYRMRLRGRAAKGGVESQIAAKIRKKTPLSRISTSSKVEFLLGKDCYKHFPDMLSDFGYIDMKKVVKEAKNKKKQKLEDLAAGSSPELEKELRRHGISTEQFELLAGITNQLTEQNILFELDAGKKNSFANWFREGIKKGSIDDNEIIYAYDKLENAAHLLETDELAALTTYAYEYRRFETDAVVGGIKDDLLYLAEKGEVNIDKHYVRPKTRFRSRKGLEKVTIREKLNQSHLTFLEALGIKVHFPKIEKRRAKINRELANKYEVGQKWKYVLREVNEIFEEVKEELAEEYKDFGRIVFNHVLTKDEYLTAKNFLKRSRLGRRSERENYLRMHSIREFEEAVPKIIAIERKVKYAKKKYEQTGDDWLREDVMKEDYVLKEDLDFKRLTSIDEDQDKVIDMLANAKLVKDRNFLNFQEKYGNDIKEMYDIGLLAKKYLKPSGKDKKCQLKRNYERLSKAGVQEVSKETNERLEKILEFSKPKYSFIQYNGEMTNELKGMKYVSKKGIDQINEDEQNLRVCLAITGYGNKWYDKGFEKKLATLKRLGEVVYLDKGYHKLDEKVYDTENMKKKKGNFTVYDYYKVKEAMETISKGVVAGEDFISKLEEINKPENKKKFKFGNKYHSWHYKNEDKKIFVSREYKKEIENVYAKLNRNA